MALNQDENTCFVNFYGEPVCSSCNFTIMPNITFQIPVSMDPKFPNTTVSRCILLGAAVVLAVVLPVTALACAMLGLCRRPAQLWEFSLRPQDYTCTDFNCTGLYPPGWCRLLIGSQPEGQGPDYNFLILGDTVRTGVTRLRTALICICCGLYARRFHSSCARTTACSTCATTPWALRRE